MASTIQVRVDDELKNQSDELFHRLGTDTTSAIRMFLTQAVMNKGFPFHITLNHTENPFAAMSEDEMISKLETSREHAGQGGYREADEMVADMRMKYGI